jgi:hypothetical protein
MKAGRAIGIPHNYVRLAVCSQQRIQTNAKKAELRMAPVPAVQSIFRDTHAGDGARGEFEIVPEQCD